MIDYNLDMRKAKVLSKDTKFQKDTRIMMVKLGHTGTIKLNKDNVYFGVVISARKNVISKIIFFGKKEPTEAGDEPGTIEASISGTKEEIELVKNIAIQYKEKLLLAPLYKLKQQDDFWSENFIIVEYWQETDEIPEA